MKCERCNRKQLETHQYEYEDARPRTVRLCGNCATLTAAVHGKLTKVRGSKDSGNAPTAGESEPDESADSEDSPTDES